MRLQHYKSDMKLYFKEHKKEIAETNWTILWQITKFAVILYLTFMVIADRFYPGWEMSREYYWMIPLLLVFGGISFVCYRKRDYHYKLGQAICFLFYAFLLFELTAIDVFANPDAPGAFFPIVIAVMPLAFIFPFHTYAILSVVAEVFFIASACRVEIAEIAKYDIFNSLVGTLFSFMAAWIIVGMRTKEGIAKSKLKRLGMIDFVTGIRNRSACELEIIKVLQEGNQNNCALFIMDLDYFKAVNDTFGHQSGDELLSQMGSILSMVFPDAIVGRLGGDEFTVFLSDIEDTKVLEQRSELLLDYLGQVKIEKGWKFSCSIGIALLEASKANFENFIRLQMMRCMRQNPPVAADM